ncbi:MAG: hypothetical protein KF798_02375 [Candidatus Paracaedibacteraceae bacterium]|nr:hypothetical protein [Candidatus Paracaedibacteraceae bacterium]
MKVEDYGNAQLDVLQTILSYKNGIPSIELTLYYSSEDIKRLIDNPVRFWIGDDPVKKLSCQEE